MSKDTYFIGIDGGGSRCRARLEDQDGNLLAAAQSGPANIIRSAEIAEASIIDAVNKALNAAELAISPSQVILCAGLAGANVNVAQQAFVKRNWPFKAVFVVSDLHAACAGAHAGKEGAVIVCGTGSSATQFANGIFTDFGGHGFPIGDKASGAWLGLQAVKLTLLGYDDLAPKDALFDAVAGHFKSTHSQEIVQACAGFNSNDYAAIVPALLPLYNSRNEAVVGLFNEGLRYLQALADKALCQQDMNLCLIGGLTELYGPRLSEAVQARITPCALIPEQGAILLAKQAITAGEL
ncbi:BadF/BadG/BcrA/BcrD ATPase family protein [Alteromonas gilva]|uniref:BadF/BadG/BcrA/BcrD ATPase family protein n=1 Tax=Alteromonas gilva TaxID=2987522 RepID=A0ABT5L044_9ALTE|nr:BadF/BadG/BcrA/BcrD ATPase family protein [Alteromonas gilva]MDC8829809.1 BadF/BadG/BcrA/BcrD ATPase family protein [Alteromonas gilva]